MRRIGLVERSALIGAGVAAAASLVWAPTAPLIAFGVLGGVLLGLLSYWAIRGVVDGLTPAVLPSIPGAETEAARRTDQLEFRRFSRGFALVKFFTRHAILAFVAYGMMARLRLDPVAMLVGVTIVPCAVALAAMRSRS